MTVTAGTAAPVTIDFAELQRFDANIQISYPDKAETYALIIAPSSGWENYRYQAGAYLIYKLLKDNGIDDDHILLISEDDIARNPNNPTPGRILPPEGDGNLYENVKVDCKPSEIKFQKLLSLFNKESSFHPGKDDNLFVYWAGKGTPEGLMWLDETIPAYQVADFFRQLSFRTLFLVLEADYSGAVGKAVEDRKVKGMLYVAAADGETSKGGIRTDAGGKMPLSNSFTDTFYDHVVYRNKGSSIYSLYYEICHTMPYYTHVRVYNAGNFGNLFTTPIGEFLNP